MSSLDEEAAPAHAVVAGCLATDVSLPEGAGPFPAVLLRTPYDRRRHRAEARGWNRHGFAAVVQDVRGRFASAGEWRPYENETADGAATARWIRRQPWSDGRYVALGASYAAHCALVLALEAPRDEPDARPDAVIAAVPALGAAETAREPTGAERLLTRAGWWAAHGDRHDSDERALAEALAADPALLTHLPLVRLPERLGRSLPSWAGLWQHRQRGRLISLAPRATVPLLAVGGHHDHFTEDTVALWRTWGGPSARLLLGPWRHGLVSMPGPDAGPAHRVALGDLYARWAHRALAGALAPGRHGAVALGGADLWLPATAGAAGGGGGPEGMGGADTRGVAAGTQPSEAGTGGAGGIAGVPRTRPFGAGAGGVDGFPGVPRTQPSEAGTGDAGGFAGVPSTQRFDEEAGGVGGFAGVPRTRPREGEAKGADAFAGVPRTQPLRLLAGARFTADPDRPVRSDDLTVPTGGAPDRCLLAGTPLARPLDAVGPVRVRLRGTADTPAADWAVRLVALTPEGKGERLAVGVLRRSRPADGEFTVELGRLARRLPAGTRLRLEIAGHHFPAHARNPHTGEDPVTAVRLLPSRREVDPASVTLTLTVLPTTSGTASTTPGAASTTPGPATTTPTDPPVDPLKEILR
ncbi:CocE/NonD family hydrolase [Streptomyces sp. NPDC014861]|uniref:CocE/NonD family hydrolase n=1 Tax=Streptomyces sp. NPDC014861 TaxID=3364923 RepID=UPI0036FD4D47